MAKAKVFRDQRIEMQNTFVTIRQKIADAQAAIRNHNNKTRRFEEEKQEANQRYEQARAKCSELRDQIADRERDLADVENQIPLAKSKMHEYESVYGENKHFEKILEQTRREVEDLQKRRDAVHIEAKTKNEDCWQAKQKLHRLEVQVEEVEKKMEFSVRRIIVAKDKIAAVESQTNTVSKNYQEASKNEMENKYYEMQSKVAEAKERRKKLEEQAMKLNWETEELEKQLQMYYEKMEDMHNGQRELKSSKIF